MSQPSVEVFKKKVTDSWDQIENKTVRSNCVQVFHCPRRVILEKERHTEKSIIHVQD